MNRFVLLGVALACAGGSAALSLASCDATLTPGCVGGPCLSDPGGGGSGGGTGGSGDGGCADTPQTGDYPCGDGGNGGGDVFNIIHTHCHRCHNDPQNCGAPFSLLTFDDTQQQYIVDRSRIRWKIMRQNVTNHPAFGIHMPFGKAPQLTAGELATLEGWLDSCAKPVPKGTGCGCPGRGCTTIDMTCPP